MSNLPDDVNLYPSGGAPFLPTEDIEQVNERKAEKAKVYTALPLIKEILERFDERIKFYDSVHSIPDATLVKPQEFMHLAAAHKLTGQCLQMEKDYLEGLIEDIK